MSVFQFLFSQAKSDLSEHQHAIHILEAHWQTWTDSFIYKPCCVYLWLWHHLYRDLTIFLPTIISNKPLNFWKTLKLHPSGKVYFSTHQGFFWIIVGELIAKSPHEPWRDPEMRSRPPRKRSPAPPPPRRLQVRRPRLAYVRWEVRKSTLEATTVSIGERGIAPKGGSALYDML